MTIPWLDDAPDAWNTVKLGGLAVPGIARVGVKPSQEVEIKKPKGKHVGSTTRQGYNAARVTIKVTVWTPEQFAELRTLIASIWPAARAMKQAGEPAKVDGPIPVSHPKTQLWGINAITLLDIEDPENDTGDRYELTLSCVEYLPPPKKSATKTDTKHLPDFEDEFSKPAPAPAKPSTTENTP